MPKLQETLFQITQADNQNEYSVPTLMMAIK